MEHLPKSLHVSLRKEFPKLNKKRVKSMLIDDLTLFLINRKNENEYFNLDKYIECNYPFMSEILDEIKADLDDLCWNYKMSFGDTALFIYTTDNPPPSCW